MIKPPLSFNCPSCMLAISWIPATLLDMSKETTTPAAWRPVTIGPIRPRETCDYTSSAEPAFPGPMKRAHCILQLCDRLLYALQRHPQLAYWASGKCILHSASPSYDLQCAVLSITYAHCGETWGSAFPYPEAWNSGNVGISQSYLSSPHGTW